MYLCKGLEKGTDAKGEMLALGILENGVLLGSQLRSCPWNLNLIYSPGTIRLSANLNAASGNPILQVLWIR